MANDRRDVRAGLRRTQRALALLAALTAFAALAVVTVDWVGALRVLRVTAALLVCASVLEPVVRLLDIFRWTRTDA